MIQVIQNIFLFIGICLVFYIVFRIMDYNKSYIKEGMSNPIPTSTSVAPGVAGNAASYGATIKAANIKSQDTFLISKYRQDYETVILNLDELVDNLMLKTALSIDATNPGDTVKRLGELNQSKLALNNIMKFIDKK